MPFCPKCGKSIEENAAFCPNCGATLTQTRTYAQPPPYVPPQPPSYGPPQAPPAPIGRPLGVTILAILEVLRGLGYLFSASYAVFGFIYLVLGVISFVLAWGLWTGRGWAWTLTIIVAALGLIWGLVTFEIISVIIDAIILFYITRPNVKQFFRRR